MLVLQPKQVKKAHQEPKTTSQAWGPPSGGVKSGGMESGEEVRGRVSGALLESMGWGIILVSFVLEGCGSACEYVGLGRLPADRSPSASRVDGDPASAVARVPWIGNMSWGDFDSDGKLCNFCLAECE